MYTHLSNATHMLEQAVDDPFGLDSLIEENRAGQQGQAGNGSGLKGGEEEDDPFSLGTFFEPQVMED